jgi:hypothetical protein
MNKREQEILIDLWRWKLLSTAAITEKHFPDQRPASAYNRLWRLRHEGLISTVHLSGKKADRAFLWTLSPKGFKEIMPHLDSMKEQGFRSEAIEHDWLVTAVHLGEWLKGVPPGCEHVSEQELRRFHTNQYPNWIPRMEDRRPDGYWRIRKGAKFGTVALEVELSQKSPTDYRSIAASYELEESIYRVLWVVKSKSISTLIENQRGAVNPNSCFNYVLASEFLEKGWDAKIYLGKDHGLSIRDLLSDPTQTQRKLVCTRSLLNTAKSPHKSDFFAYRSETSKLHRLGSSLVSTPLSSLPSNNPSQGEPTNEQ